MRPPLRSTVRRPGDHPPNRGRKRLPPRPYRLGRRAESSEKTRRRIVEAALALHVEKGIASTSARDVAARAAVGVGSVYNHFPTYEALVRACAAEVTLITQPPQLSTFEGIHATAERVRLLVRELFAYYDRYHWFELIRCDRHKLPMVAQAVQRREEARREIVREALRPLEPNEPTVTMVFALTDFAVHSALIADGMSTAGAADQVAAVLLAWLRGPPVGLRASAEYQAGIIRRWIESELK